MTLFSELPRLTTRDAAYWVDPHAALRKASERSPVAVDDWDTPVLLRYDDCASVLADDTTFTIVYDTMLSRHGIVDGPLVTWWSLAMMNNNNPVHSRLRSLVSRPFTIRSVDRLRRDVASRADLLLESRIGDGAMEFIGDFAHLLPIAVICELVGVPRVDHDAFNRWTTEMHLMFSEAMPEENRRTAESAVRGLNAYIGDLVDQRRRSPSDDLLTALIASEEDGDRLSRDELIAIVIDLLMGGHGTTRSLLTIAVCLLAQWPDLTVRLREAPSQIPGFVEEVLRYEPPISSAMRRATADVEFHGITMPAGTAVSMSILAANRDSAHYRDPDRFLIGREEAAPILSFGRGIHHCLGANLARLEVIESVQVILRRFSDFALSGGRPNWIPFLVARQMNALPLQFTANTARAFRSEQD